MQQRFHPILQPTVALPPQSRCRPESYPSSVRSDATAGCFQQCCRRQLFIPSVAAITAVGNSAGNAEAHTETDRPAIPVLRLRRTILRSGPATHSRGNPRSGGALRVSLLHHDVHRTLQSQISRQCTQGQLESSTTAGPPSDTAVNGRDSSVCQWASRA